MAVRCEGDRRLLEQLGEKQDFEAELSRLGLAHEEYALDVRRQGRSAEWSQSYTVIVTNVSTHKQSVYRGGPAKDWIAAFRRDIAGAAVR